MFVKLPMILPKADLAAPSAPELGNAWQCWSTLASWVMLTPRAGSNRSHPIPPVIEPVKVRIPRRIWGLKATSMPREIKADVDFKGRV